MVPVVVCLVQLFKQRSGFKFCCEAVCTSRTHNGIKVNAMCIKMVCFPVPPSFLSPCARWQQAESCPCSVVTSAVRGTCLRGFSAVSELKLWNVVHARDGVNPGARVPVWLCHLILHTIMGPLMSYSAVKQERSTPWSLTLYLTRD